MAPNWEMGGSGAVSGLFRAVWARSGKEQFRAVSGGFGAVSGAVSGGLGGLFRRQFGGLGRQISGPGARVRGSGPASDPGRQSFGSTGKIPGVEGKFRGQTILSQDRLSDINDGRFVTRCMDAL